ncbi:HU family DNA-binding protein [Candidatus Woesearchaeota archaeon]|nr:HU family DNA-binding protein [Candidatus Woesearchaeota archaeon]
MNKGELVEKIAKDTGLSKKDAEGALVSVLSTVCKAVKKESVQLVGFGTFKNSKRKARMGVNPQTGAKIKIPARTVMTFKASKNPKY